MSTVVKKYDAHLDAKNRLTLRGADFEYYEVKIFSDGRVILEPRVLVHPDEISGKTLKMMDQSVENLKKGKVSPAIDLDKYLNQAESR